MTPKRLFATLVSMTAQAQTSQAREICAVAARLHATTADLVHRLASFDAEEGWRTAGITSCEQWLAVYAGFDFHQARRLLDAARALRTMPALDAAFSAGEVSLDKVAALSKLSAPGDDTTWAELARTSTPAQLTRIARAYEHAQVVASEDVAAQQRERRSLHTQWQDDGMLRLVAVLPPADGALVLAALDRVAERTPSTGTPEQHRADALVSICDAQVGDDVSTAHAAVMVHVDAAVLTGEQTTGRCHLANGPSLALSVARRLGCDATVIPAIDKDGVPINLGRARRLVSAPLRRALHLRDKACSFPGCNVPARATHAHHIEHWAHGGATDLDNLTLLCSFHHHRLHDGEIRLRPSEDGRLQFLDSAGDLIGPMRVSSAAVHDHRPPVTAQLEAALPAA